MAGIITPCIIKRITVKKDWKGRNKVKKLQIGNFYVDDIIFGDKTGFQNGILTVNKQEALACLDPEERLKIWNCILFIRETASV